MNDFYDDFRRAHMDILVRQIVCTDVIFDDKPSDRRNFQIRYHEARKEFNANLHKYLNASDTSDCHLLEGQRIDMFLDIVSDSLDKLFHLFFEAGMQSGILFSLDMGLMGKSDLISKDMHEKLETDESIIRELLKNAME